MSYILEALKKAESERERGQVPGLNAAPVNHTSSLAQGQAFRPWWHWLLVLLLLLALVYGVWRRPWAGPPDAPVAHPEQAPAAFPVDTALPPLAASAVAVPAAGPLAPAASTVAHVQARVMALPAGPALAAETAGAAPLEALPKPLPTPQHAAPGLVPLLQDLPDSLRRQIPALNISGAIYSDSPAEWTLIINDQVMAKGSQVAPELRLEDIGPGSAVFNFRGQRFRLER